MHDALFQPIALGAIEAKNRILMAPLTRGRASPGAVPNELLVEYYRQRASAGLILSAAAIFIMTPFNLLTGAWLTIDLHRGWVHWQMRR